MTPVTSSGFIYPSSGHESRVTSSPAMPKLSSRGMEMPVIGFGTSSLGNCGEIVANALKAGYRHIDTAWKYGTEKGVGEGIKASGVSRKDIFLVTKVSHEYLKADAFAKSVEESLQRLQTDYVDLLFVHWPAIDGTPLAETIGALAKAKREGKARHIGVANFNISMTEEAMRLSPEPLAVLQGEYHPFLKQEKVLAFCRKAGLAFMAYCPLGRGRVFREPVLADIAKSRGKTVAQIALRWLVQQGNIAPIPRSANPQHMAESLQVFDFTLTDEEMKRIHALARPDGRIADPAGRAPAWD